MTAKKLTRSSGFRVGDVVEVSELPSSMAHFARGKAIICGYSRSKHQAGTDWEHNYSLCFIRGGSYNPVDAHSWYHSSNLKMIKKGLAHEFDLSLKDED